MLLLETMNERMKGSCCYLLFAAAPDVDDDVTKSTGGRCCCPKQNASMGEALPGEMDE